MLINILLVFSFVSCSQISKEYSTPKWNYPPDNPFPSILKQKEYADQRVALLAKLKANTLKMTCNLRNDSPYYWCGLEGELLNPSSELPKKLGTFFHVVVAEEGKQAAINLTNRMIENGEAVTAVLNTRPFIMDDNKSVSSQLYGFYNSKECFDLFDDYSLCPNTAKKLDIFSGKYLE